MALNQHAFAVDFFTFRHELMLFLIWLPLAGIAFAVTLWGLMIYKAFAGRVSLEVALRASLRVGIAVYLFLPFYQLPFFLFQRSNDAVAIAGLCLDAIALVVGIIAAVRVVRFAQNPTVSV
ncbi:MAG: hypothetical protein WB561_16030 [Terracidiphilus sp.]